MLCILRHYNIDDYLLSLVGELILILINHAIVPAPERDIDKLTLLSISSVFVKFL